MTFRPLFPLALGGLDTLHASGTFRAVFGPVGAGDEQRPADGAPLGVQAISYSLLCRWFRAAVLPLDRELETALFHRLDAKRCAVCGALFTPGSNRAKYCPECAPKVHRRQKAECERRRRVQRGQLEDKNPL